MAETKAHNEDRLVYTELDVKEYSWNIMVSVAGIKPATSAFGRRHSVR